MHHHTPLFGTGHLALIVAVGALGCILGAAFVFSWRDSEDKLRSILSEIDDDRTPPPHDQEHCPGPPTRHGPR